MLTVDKRREKMSSSSQFFPLMLWFVKDFFIIFLSFRMPPQWISSLVITSVAIQSTWSLNILCVRLHRRLLSGWLSLKNLRASKKTPHWKPLWLFFMRWQDETARLIDGKEGKKYVRYVVWWEIMRENKDDKRMNEKKEEKILKWHHQREKKMLIIETRVFEKPLTFFMLSAHGSLQCFYLFNLLVFVLRLFVSSRHRSYLFHVVVSWSLWCFLCDFLTFNADC